MKRIMILIMMITSVQVYGQRYIADSVYLKPVTPYAGKWLSVKTKFGVNTSDTIDRTKVMTRKASDSLYLKLNSYKADTVTRTKLMTRKATDSLYYKLTQIKIDTVKREKLLTRKASDSLYYRKNIPFVKGVSDGAKNYIPFFVAGKTDSLGTYPYTAYFDNSLVLPGFNGLPSAGQNNIYGLVVAGNYVTGSGSVAFLNRNTISTLASGFTFAQYTNTSTVTPLVGIKGHTGSGAPSGSIFYKGKLVNAFSTGDENSYNNYHELEINGRGRFTQLMRLGGVYNDTSNFNFEFDGRTSTLNILPRVDAATSIRFSNAAKTLFPIVINTSNGLAYRNSTSSIDSVYPVRKEVNDLISSRIATDTITRTKILTRKAADSLYKSNLVLAGSSSIGAVKYNGMTPLKGAFYTNRDENPDSTLTFGGVLKATGTYYGLNGFSSNGYGVYGNGVYGIYGIGSTSGVYGNGATFGIYGQSSSNYGVYGTGGTHGVYGNGTQYGVYGTSNSTGVYGYSSGGVGVKGIGTQGVVGDGTQFGILGTSTNGIGLNATSTNNRGAVILSTNKAALYAKGDTGIYVEGTNHTAIHAYSRIDIAIYVRSDSNFGIYSYTNKKHAIYGNSVNGEGIKANSINSTAADFTNASPSPTLYVKSNDTLNAASIIGRISIVVKKTSINGSTSGYMLARMPFSGEDYKKVILYCKNLNGTATYTFPVAFTYTPVVLNTTGLPTSLVTSLTTTSVTVTGSNSTGFLIIEGF